MSWEVQTMKSKISFFNAGLFRSTLRRFWPLWTIHFAGWLLFLPVLTLMNNLGPNKSTNFIFAICENAVFASSVVAFIMAILAAMAVFSVPSNYFITYPAYVQFYHMPLEAILGMYQAILPSADSLMKCLVIFNLPFTLVKGLLDAVLCMVIYKPLSPILHGRK